MNSLASHLSPIPPRETLSADALARLKELLITGQVMPGETLPLRRTAEALGVSMMPVRQATYQLVADRALEVGPSRSVRVPIMSQDEFREVTRIRLCVEGFAVAEAAQLADSGLIAHLREINACLSRKAEEETQNATQMILMNKQFHFSIYAAARMPLLMKIIEALWLRIGPALNYYLRTSPERMNHKVSVACHIKLLDAIENKDGDAARDALTQDIESAFLYICGKMYANGKNGLSPSVGSVGSRKRR